MSDETKQKLAEQFEKVFGFLPEDDPKSDPEGVRIVELELTRILEAVIKLREDFEARLQPKGNGGPISEDLRSLLISLRKTIRIAETDYNGAYFLATETGYIGVETKKAPVPPANPDLSRIN